MAQMVYDLVDPAELVDYVRAYDNEVLRPDGQFRLGEFLPALNIDDLEYRVRKGSLQDVDVAEFRSWDVPSPMTGRAGTTRIKGELGPISRAIPLTEEETLRRRALERGTDDPIIQAIFDDAERMVRAVQARVELARGDVINDGIVTISENDLSLTVDFGRAGAMSVTAGTLWTDTVNATPLTNLLAWQEAYEDQNGVSPAYMIMSRTRLQLLALNAEMLAYAAAGGTTPNRINRATIDAILQDEGLPPVWLYDGKVRVGGVSTRILPTNKVFLAPPTGEPVGNTFYGPTAESIKLASRGYIEASAAPGIVAVVLQNDHPVQTVTNAVGVAMPVTPNPDLFMDCTIAA